MSYNIYTTRAIILSDRPIREADRLYNILTRDLGLIRARALGSRKEGSKLKASLEPISISVVSLVKGQTYWRLTSAFLEKNLISVQRQKKSIALSISRAVSLLERLVQGEEKNSDLFDALEEVFLFAESEKVKPSDAVSIEILLVVKILFYLGYLGEGDLPQNILKENVSEQVLEKVANNKKDIIEVINSSIRSANLA